MLLRQGRFWLILSHRLSSPLWPVSLQCYGSLHQAPRPKPKKGGRSPKRIADSSSDDDDGNDSEREETLMDKDIASKSKKNALQSPHRRGDSDFAVPSKRMEAATPTETFDGLKTLNDTLLKILAQQRQQQNILTEIKEVLQALDPKEFHSQQPSDAADARRKVPQKGSEFLKEPLKDWKPVINTKGRAKSSTNATEAERTEPTKSAKAPTAGRAKSSRNTMEAERTEPTKSAKAPTADEASEPTPPPKCTLIVSLSPSQRVEDANQIGDLFRPYGIVKDVSVRGSFATIIMASEAEATCAEEFLEGTTFKGEPLSVRRLGRQ